MAGSWSFAGSSTAMGDVSFPLVTCDQCKCRTVKVLTSRTLKNPGKRFYICPSRKREDSSSGCSFWFWEDEYEGFLMDNGHVPENYKPIYERNANKVVKKKNAEKGQCSSQLQIGGEQGKQRKSDGAAVESEVKMPLLTVSSDHVAVNEDENLMDLRPVLAVCRDIVFLLKCVLVVCVLVEVTLLYGMFREN